MQRADKALADALKAGERTVSHTTRLGGKDVTRQVQSWQVERAYSTDLPAAMRAFSGSASAQLTLDLGGDGERSAPELYSPWADRFTGDIARPGQSVVHTAGVGPATLPAFRGTVRARSAASGTDTVQITALDGAERLRGPGSLPKPYGGFRLRRPVASATWCVDELLRQGGLHTCPPPRAPEITDSDPLTILYASLHGGFAATYGQPEDIPAPSDYTWVRDGAPHEMAVLPKRTGMTASWFTRSRVTVPGSRLFAEAWVNNAVGPGDRVEISLALDRAGTAEGLLRLAVDFGNGDVQITSGTTASGGTWGWNWPAVAALKGAWHIGFYVDAAGSGSTVLPTVQPLLAAPDGTVLIGALSTYTNAAHQQVASELVRVDLYTDLAVECLQVTSRLPGPLPWADFAQTGQWTRGARLDDMILPLTTVPQVSGSQWDVIAEIAKASMSTAEFDEHGIFRWRNYTRFATTPTTADLTLTSVRDIAALTITEEIDACRNYCVQPYRDWSATGIDYGTVFDDTVIRSIPPLGTIEMAYALAEDEFDIGPPLTVDDSVSAGGSRARFAADDVAGAAAVKGAVEMAVRRAGGSLLLRFTNRSSNWLYTVTSDGKPSVHLETLKPAQDPVERRVAAWNTVSQQYYGLQEYTAESSEWVQDQSAALDLAIAMRSAGRFPVPVIGDVEVLYNPRVQLGDVVRLVDTSGAELNTLAWVIGINTTAGADGVVQQTLTLRGTAYNDVPQDLYLEPDPPVEPGYGRAATYTEVARTYPTLGDLIATHATWRDVMAGT